MPEALGNVVASSPKAMFCRNPWSTDMPHRRIDAPHSSPVVNPMLGMIASGMPMAIRNPCFQSMQR